MTFHIEAARQQDTSILHALVRGLAEYEKLLHLVSGTEEQLREELFGTHPVIEAVIGWDDDRAVGFALFFHNFSTFLARRGLYLEDLFVLPEARGRGYGKRLIRYLAQLAVARQCGRFEWAVLDWNQPAITFYKKLNAQPMHDWTVFRVSGPGLGALADRF